MEYANGGDVGRLLYKNEAPPPSFKKRMKIARDCAYGMNYLHSQHPPLL